LVGTTADFRCFGPRSPLPLNDLPDENRATAGRIGEVRLAGALVGGLLFRVLGLFPRLGNVAISLRDVVAAFVGSLLVLTALWLWQRWKGSS
jgi:uncharacterized membrane protein YeaQ/YmgE (transglycosylase-associated protein family)